MFKTQKIKKEGENKKGFLYWAGMSLALMMAVFLIMASVQGIFANSDDWKNYPFDALDREHQLLTIIEGLDKERSELVEGYQTQIDEKEAQIATLEQETVNLEHEKQYSVVKHDAAATPIKKEYHCLRQGHSQRDTDECNRLKQKENAFVEFYSGAKEPKQDVPSYEIFVTSYNPEVGQTDSSPCIGANGDNLCELAKEGYRVLALSQDLVGKLGNKAFSYGDMVRMESEIEQCNGEFVILDTMNKRFKNYGDLFFMERKNNTSCPAIIRKL